MQSTAIDTNLHRASTIYQGKNLISVTRTATEFKTFSLIPCLSVLENIVETATRASCFVSLSNHLSSIIDKVEKMI